MDQELQYPLLSGAFEKRLWLFYRNVHIAMEEMFACSLSEWQMSVTQIRILLSLLEKGTISVGELAEIIRMNSGNCSTMCKKLEQMGFLSRERSHEDERIVILHINEQGKQLLADILMSVHQQQKPLLARLSAAEVAEISAALDCLERFFLLIKSGQLEARPSPTAKKEVQEDD